MFSLSNPLPRRESRGFTLIELLVVIAIIGILASIVLASLNSARRKSRDARRIADVKQLQLALELYFDGNSGSYVPGTSMADLATQGFIPAVPAAPAPGSYSYQGLNGSSGNCAATPCVSYVLRAQLEEDLAGGPLSNDVDSGAGTVDCSDASRYYCVRP